MNPSLEEHGGIQDSHIWQHLPEQPKEARCNRSYRAPVSFVRVNQAIQDTLETGKTASHVTACPCAAWELANSFPNLPGWSSFAGQTKPGALSCAECSQSRERDGVVLSRDHSIVCCKTRQGDIEFGESLFLLSRNHRTYLLRSDVCQD